ncbi:MAG: M56 family metallopeptidase [Planctomycetota bacterium]
MGTLAMQLRPVFDWLLWVSIQGSMLIVLIVLVQILLRGRLGIRWHYMLWVLLLIRLAVPWLPESKMSIFNLLPRSIQQGRITEAFSEPQNARGMGFYLYAESEEAQEATPQKNFFTKFVNISPLLWLFGVIALGIYVAGGNLHLWWLVTKERPLTDQKVLDLLEDCKSEMSIRTILGVVITDKVKSPALFGFVRPRLLLPSGIIENLSLKELRHVFLHELAHLKRHDIYLGYLVSLLQSLHWFNPMIWLAFYRIRSDRELACDALVLAQTHGSESKDYGRTIVSLLERFSHPRHLPAMAGILETKSQLKRRIKMIAKFKKTSRSRWAGAVLLLAVLACVVLTNAYVARADFIFDTPINLGPTFNCSGWNGAVSISPNSLELYFGSEDGNIWVARREAVNSNWGPALNLGPIVNSSYIDGGPCISTDGLTLYLDSDRRGGLGDVDIWVTTRVTMDDNWGTPINLGPGINSTSWDWGQSLSADGLQLYFTSNRPGGLGGQDMYVVRRETINEPWSEPVNLGSTLNSSSGDQFPHISADGLLLFFGSNRPGGYGSWDLYVAKRTTTKDPWRQKILGIPP